MDGPYFTGITGGKHYYKGLAETIKQKHPEERGKHIFSQLMALGLMVEFEEGSTPYGLPYSFSDYEEKDDERN